MGQTASAAAPLALRLLGLLLSFGQQQQQQASAMLWFPRAPNNLADLDGLTTRSGEFWLRYDNGACGPADAAADGRCAAGPGGHCGVGIVSFGGAHSTDGVHWDDRGAMMVAFDEGKACPQTSTGSGAVWKRLPAPPLPTGSSPSLEPATPSEPDEEDEEDEEEQWVINYSESGAVIRFMTSSSPGGPWKPVGGNHTTDGWGPGHVPLRPQDGGQYYAGMWNTQNVWSSPKTASGWNGTPARMFGWNTGYAKVDRLHAFGFASSSDGLNWTAEPPARIVFDAQHNRNGNLPLENGGCAWAAAAQRWVCLLGFRGTWANIDGHQGMAAFSSPSPGGPYTIAKHNALFMAYQNPAAWSTGTNAPTYFARFWTRYDTEDPSSPPELLVVHMSYTGKIDDSSENVIYLAPLKQAQVDVDGSMRLVWWKGNERMKGPPMAQRPTPSKPPTASPTQAGRIPVNNRNGTILEVLWPAGNGSCSGGSVLVYPTVAAPDQTDQTSTPAAPPHCAPPVAAAAAAAAAMAPHRYWRLSTSSSLGNRWDICSIDFFASADGSGPSLVNRSHGAAVAFAGANGGGKPQDVIGADPLVCNVSNSTTWMHRWGASPMPGWVGWDFSAGQACAPYCTPVSVGSVRVRQYDTEFCAKTMAVQWSDDGKCWHNAWFIDASKQCPYDATHNPAAGITTSPPALAPAPPPLPPPPPAPSSIVFEIGVDDAMQMKLYSRVLDPSGKLLPNRTLLETGDRGIPAVAAASGRCHVRVLIRGSMLEAYVNDVLLLPVPLKNTITPGGFADSSWAHGVRAPVVEIGLEGSWGGAAAERGGGRGTAAVPELKAWTMDLPALFPMR